MRCPTGGQGQFQPTVVVSAMGQLVPILGAARERTPRAPGTGGMGDCSAKERRLPIILPLSVLVLPAFCTVR